MRIGTITFHWGTNYGAVMQAYALQNVLNNMGNETEIIDYLPIRVATIQKVNELCLKNFNFFKKEKNIENFRKNELKLSIKTYKNSKALKKCRNSYDAVICGSDQIWNESFLLHSESCPNLSYYLDFVAANSKKISYAVSFGTNKLSNKSNDLVLPQLQKFNSISVREKTGQEILSNINIKSEIVLDPTLLLNKDNYNSLLDRKTFSDVQKVFSYIIHNEQNEAIKISNYVKAQYSESFNGKYYDIYCGIYEWLNNIKNAEVVVTNSFHGMVFSIIFNTPFIVVPVHNSKMNDRLTTLLSQLDLENRIVYEYNSDIIEKVLSAPINWTEVENKLKSLKQSSYDFLTEALNK